MSRYRAQRTFHHINLDYPGLTLVHEEPYVFVAHNFLNASECAQLMSLAGECQRHASATAPEQEARRTCEPRQYETQALDTCHRTSPFDDPIRFVILGQRVFSPSTKM